MNEQDQKTVLIWYVIPATIINLIILLFVCATCHAQTINVNALADSIYWAEGGLKTSHPYGIMHKYRTTTPRQACINTIRHRLSVWNGQENFIVFLGKTYSPPSINPYWVKNVRYFYDSFTKTSISVK